MKKQNHLDETDNAILAEKIVARENIAGPRVGDYVSFPTGELERISHDWGEALQTSPGGSFFLYRNGQGSFSGGLNPATPLDKLELTHVQLPGSFWFFHHDRAGAGRGVHFEIPCRVYRTSAAYEGFLGREFQSEKVDALKAQLEKDLRTVPVLDEQYQNIKHPHTNYSLGEAVALAVNNAKTFGRKVPVSLREVRDYIADMAQRTDHQWLTGYAALDVLDAAIDGKDISKANRLV